MSERKIDPKFNIHENYKKMIFFNPYRNEEVNPLQSDITSYWNLNSNAIDQVGGKNGIETNISYVSGKIESCAYFSLANILLPENIISPVNGEFFISFWIKMFFCGRNQRSVSFNNNLNAPPVIYETPSDDSIKIIGGFGGTNNIVIDSVDNLVWNHVVISSKEFSKVDVYINNVLRNTSSFTGSYNQLSGNNNFLGANRKGVDNTNCEIDELIIGNKIIDNTIVDYIYNKGNSGLPII